MDYKLTTLASLALLAAACRPCQETKIKVPSPEIPVEQMPVPDTFAGQRDYVNLYFSQKGMEKAVMPFDSRKILIYARDSDIDTIPDYEIWISHKNDPGFPFVKEPELILIDRSRKDGIGSVDLIGYTTLNEDFTVTSHTIENPTELQRMGADQAYATIINLIAKAIHGRTMSLYDYGHGNDQNIDPKSLDEAINSSRDR
ncbi:MAG: hypothetical protein AABX05_04850 [Nanoarchaeota archaeon]